MARSAATTPVARQRQLETAAQRRTVHRGHDGDVEVVDATEDLVPEPRSRRCPSVAPMAAIAAMSAPAQKARSRAPVMTTARTAWSCATSSSAARQRAQRGGVEGVERLRPVQPQRRDAVAARDENGLDVAVRHLARGHNVFEPGLPLRACRRPDRCGASAKNAWRSNGGRAIACRRTSDPTTTACRLRACPDGSPQPSSP